MKILILALMLIIIPILYACLLVAKTSDEQAERMWQEYMEYKQRKENEKHD